MIRVGSRVGLVGGEGPVMIVERVEAREVSVVWFDLAWEMHDSTLSMDILELRPERPETRITQTEIAALESVIDGFSDQMRMTPEVNEMVGIARAGFRKICDALEEV